MNTRHDRDDDGINILPLILAPFALFAIVHAIRNRTPDDFINYPLFLAVPLFVALASNRLSEHIQGRREYRKTGKKSAHSQELTIGFVIAIAALSYVGGIFYYMLGATLIDLYRHFFGPSSGRTPTVLLTIAITLALGIALFIFRLKARVLYGITEIMVGVTVAAYRVTSNPEFSADVYLAVLTAGIYLIVRGLDNIHQGIKFQPTNPVTRIVTGATPANQATPKDDPSEIRTETRS